MSDGLAYLLHLEMGSSVKSEVDDFEVEAQEAAAIYAHTQRAEADREKLKLENKARRRAGLAPLPVPRKVKVVEAKRQDSDDDSSDNSDDSDTGNNLIHHNAKELRYEGQVLLKYNPLYRLSGLPDPQNGQHAMQSAKTDMIEQMHKRVHTSGDKAAPSVINKLEPGTTGNVHQEAQTKIEMQEGVGEEEEIEEEEYIEDDDQVVVPWGQAIDASQGTLAKEEEEGTYSEDELVAPQAPPDRSQEPSAASLLSSMIPSLPPVRPAFETTPEQDSIGALALDEAISVPASINRFLRPYQRDGAKFLFTKYKENTGGVLGDDMGLGKTIQVVAFLAAIMRKTGRSEDFERRKRFIRSSEKPLSPKFWPTALIVCPKSLMGNWEREINTWGFFEIREWRTETATEVGREFNQGFVDILLATYDSVRTSIDQLKEMPLSVVLADEAHRLKEPRGKIGLAMKKLKCPSCFALTGTLIQNRLEEMWSVLDFVQRGQAGTLKEWRQFVVNPIKKGQRREGMANEVVVSILRLGVMHKDILPHFVLRRTKKIIANELPHKRDLIVFCPLAARQVKAYQAFVQSEDVEFVVRRDELCDCGSERPRKSCHYRTNSEGEEVKEVLLKCISSAIKISNHFGLLYPAMDDSVKTLQINRRLYRICTGQDYDQRMGNAYEAAIDPENCGKWTLLQQLLVDWRNEKVGNKVLIFSNTVRLLKMIDEFIVANFSGFDHNLLTGEVDGSQRQAMVDDFQNPEGDHFILLVSTLAGGVGLNLTAANKVVIFDPAWNPAHDLQAMDRAFRIGQKRPVDVYRLIGQGTIEENMYERQIQKEQRARQLNEGTFERRIHQGIDKGKGELEQGELYGVQNIFRFDPAGTVSKNLDRVRLAEDRFLQDLVESEYQANDEGGSDTEDEAGQRMLEDRKLQARRRALAKSRAASDPGGPSVERRDDPLRNTLKVLNVQAHEHAAAFKDSPEERAIFEIGLELLHTNPELAKSIKANDLGKYARSSKTRTKAAKTPTSDPDKMPWEDRIARPTKRKADLAVLSDDSG